ncbi:anti-sigma factor family protein [Agromyces cerinus]|uniref:Putative zinc-finger n=1 Tax=Agromyces cerinus subsp. cerinus TaxID=232089 RepID=A0A1N6HN36_9MICO|nr:zf-HC2 domain-containing protein [Agromyces cerinus]SIO21268.1 Putative zinc-finger [Agromyces cerinus subsp. cerinus]
MNADHARFADWDSAYVLGALSPVERGEYEQHLESCELCRRSVAELAPMPGLLARLSPERAEALMREPDDGSAPAPAPRDDLLDAVRLEDRRRRRRRARTWWVASAAAAAAAAVLVIVAIAVPLALTRPSVLSESVAFEAVAEVPLSATATLTQVAWGTRIELDCRYAEAEASDAPAGGWPYALVVVGRDGERTDVSSWRASPGAAARLSAGAALDLDEIASLEIRAIGSGDVLMRSEFD